MQNKIIGKPFGYVEDWKSNQFLGTIDGRSRFNYSCRTFGWKRKATMYWTVAFERFVSNEIVIKRQNYIIHFEHVRRQDIREKWNKWNRTVAESKNQKSNKRNTQRNYCPFFILHMNNSIGSGGVRLVRSCKWSLLKKKKISSFIVESLSYANGRPHSNNPMSFILHTLFANGFFRNTFIKDGDLTNMKWI